MLKKWDQLQEEIASTPEGLEGGVALARQLSCGSISSISSASSMSSAGCNGHANGGSAYGGGHASPLVTADTPRVVKQLSLSMSMISEDISEEDDDSTVDEW